MDRIVVIGGGIAGLSVTWALARQGRSVVLLEKEPHLAQHSSAMNAGIFRVSVPERINVRLALRSLELGRELLSDRYLSQIGGLYPCAVDSTRAAILDAAMDAGVALAPKSLLPEWLTHQDRPTLWSPLDGVINVEGVIQALAGATLRLGAEIRTGTAVTDLIRTSGRVTGVRAGDDELAASTVVDCSGAWSARLPGAPPQAAVQPHRRHILVLEAVPGVKVDRVVWDLTDGIYVRPAPDGVMTCPCDETAYDVEAGYETDAAIPARLREKLVRWAPVFAESRVVRWWAGLRPLTPDHRFIVGEDPTTPGLFRVGGFGGHGMTAGLAAGEIAAALLDGRDVPEAAELNPNRFSQTSVH